MSTDAETGPHSRQDEPRQDEPRQDDTSEERAPGGMRADWMDALRDVAPYLDLGWRIAGAAAIPPIVGWGVDVWLETVPWGVGIGALLGLVSAALQLRQVGNELDARSAAAQSERTASGSAGRRASRRTSGRATSGTEKEAEAGLENEAEPGADGEAG